jgi:hypothetical protein
MQLAEIRAVCGRLNRACKCIQGSDGFAAVLQRLLIVGNAMNEGTQILVCLNGCSRGVSVGVEDMCTDGRV